MAAFKLPKPASSVTSNKATPLQPLQTGPQLGSKYSDACNWGHDIQTTTPDLEIPVIFVATKLIDFC